MSEKQIQKAGDGSQQIQAENVHITYGISEQRVREICSEVAVNAVLSHSSEASEIALKRIDQFVDLLLPRIQQIEKEFDSFSDPSFQVLLRKAELAAACTERDCDYQMLAELLAHRIEKGEERKTKASIFKAVEIVDQIDDDALCAMTVLYAIFRFIPTHGSISQGLQIMDDLFSSLCYKALPNDLEWAYHLDALNAVRVSSVGTFKKLKEYYTDELSGYICIGILKNSETHEHATRILQQANLPASLLVDHELNDGYVRLNIVNLNILKDTPIYILTSSGEQKAQKATALEIEAIHNVWELYSKDGALKKAVQNSFMEKWDSFNSLKAVREWCESIPNSITIMPTGKVLAHANAQRKNKDVPDMDK